MKPLLKFAKVPKDLTVDTTITIDLMYIESICDPLTLRRGLYM